ncbi:hypothetical protein [Jannaschia aquimarina]|uniref:hypothetical protein n=1 Tax=Jannaschia aquimarina TaxID=935700 RepID=UPI000B6E9B31|nr:hypothetical protein [Jannaschia aquimarina]SNS52260.1 hypothetical protein SAMN05421775_101298 [Jannaschia aquimarina]
MILPLEAIGGYDFGPFFLDLGVGAVAIVAALVFVVLLVWGASRSALVVPGLIAAAGAAFLARHAVAAVNDAVFFAQNPGYAAQALPFEGRSVWVPNPCRVAYALWGVNGARGNSFLECGLPLADRLADGTLDFFELGTEPVSRFTLRVADPACFASHQHWDVVRGFMISAPLGICVLGEPVDRSEADHILSGEQRDIPGFSDWWYVHYTLTRVSDGLVVDRFDSWGGATPYGGPTPPPEGRRPTATIAALVDRPDRTGFFEAAAQRTADLLLDHPFDQTLLRAAMGSPTQNDRADAYFFACRDDVRPLLDAGTVAAVNAGMRDTFPDGPARYPQDCRDFAREFRGGVRLDPDGRAIRLAAP